MTRIAVFGCGHWGKNLVRNFHEMGHLHTVCDTDRGRGKLVVEKYPDVDFCTDTETVLACPEIDAVVIATPAATHHELAKSALRAGKDVFVEKPLSLHVKQAEELVSLADEHQRILMVGHLLRYHPAVVRLNRLIRDGDLGRVEYIYSNRLNIGKFRTEENILWSFAPHDISVMLALLDEEPSEVVCQGGDYLNDHIADVTMSQFVFPSGVRGHIFVSWLHPFKEQRLVVVGSEKMAAFDDTSQDKLRLYPHRVAWRNRTPTAVKAEAEKVELEMDEPLRLECEHFIHCVETRAQPTTDGREGLRVLRVLEWCQECLATGGSAAVGSDNEKRRAPDAYFAHPTACIDEGSVIGRGSKIWHFSHVMGGARIGRHTSIGQSCFVAPEVVIGNNVKVQNNVSVYTGTRIEDDVFLGPSCVLTNVTNPRAQVNRRGLYENTLVRRGATIGANATILCGVVVGRYAFVAAGAVVTRDVPDYALVAGTPARRVGWMSRHGHRLGDPDADGVMTCPESGYRYRTTQRGELRCLDCDEESPLPCEHSVGARAYRTWKKSDEPSLKRHDSP